MNSNLTALLRRTILSVTVVTGCTVFATTARAQCSAMTPKPAIAWQALPSYAPMYLPPSRPDRSTPEARGGSPSIVGLWQVNFTSGGQVVDQAFEVYHGDGTELMVDTSAPASDNVCVGVWAQTGGLTFKLNHPSWTFDAQGNLNGTATIKLDITLDANSNIFTGTFAVDVFDLHGTVLQHLTGTVAAKRVTVD